MRNNIRRINNFRNKALFNFIGVSMINFRKLKVPLKVYIDTLEKELIEDALKETKYNQTQASYLLGLKRTTLTMKMRKYGITYKKSN